MNTSLFKACCRRGVLMFALGCAGMASAHGAVVVSWDMTNPGTFPGSPTIGTSTATVGGFENAGGNGLQQTFTVTNTFKLDKLVVSYSQNSSQISTNSLSIYEVSDPLALNYTEPLPGAMLLNPTAGAFSISRTGAGFSGTALMTLDLTGADEITLQAGKSYAISIKTITTSTSNIFLGVIYGANNAASNYLPGQLYSNEIKFVDTPTPNEGDLGFALYAVPETSAGSLGLLGLVFLGVIHRSRRGKKLSHC